METIDKERKDQKEKKESMDDKGIVFLGPDIDDDDESEIGSEYIEDSFEERRPVREYRIEDGVLVDETPEPEPPSESRESWRETASRGRHESVEPESDAEEASEAGESTGSTDKVADLKRELAAARADFYNYRQRTMRERQALRQRAVEDAIVTLLPVLDNLDRALMVPEDGKAKDVLIGVRMVQRQFLSTLEELGVTAIPSEGQRFDPTLHEAAGTAPVEDEEEDGLVVEEQLRGYKAKDRVLRAARVIVGKAEE